MPQSKGVSLWGHAFSERFPLDRFIADRFSRIYFHDILTSTVLDSDVEDFRNKVVLIVVKRPLFAALAVLELDGVAKRLVLVPPDVQGARLQAVVEEFDIDYVLSDEDQYSDLAKFGLRRCGLPKPSAVNDVVRDVVTEWALFTSGTTGLPKMIVHRLCSLTDAFSFGGKPKPDAVWSTFYDIRRFGGLQILLRGLCCGNSLLLSDPGISPPAFFEYAKQNHVTHMSGTPSQWRLVLMSAATEDSGLTYIRLSGEVVDQPVLNELRRRFPEARISHAYASTEGGVAFDVEDGLAGFPASWLDQSDTKVFMTIKYGSLHLRSRRIGRRYFNGSLVALTDADGFLDTGDMLDVRNGRCYFDGRREGVINVGGLKVHPEEIEAVLNRHPMVLISRVHGRRNPLMGTIVVADVVIKPDVDYGLRPSDVTHDILASCREVLPAHKVPAVLHAVKSLDVTVSGKLSRAHA